MTGGFRIWWCLGPQNTVCGENKPRFCTTFGGSVRECAKNLEMLVFCVAVKIAFLLFFLPIFERKKHINCLEITLFVGKRFLFWHPIQDLPLMVPHGRCRPDFSPMSLMLRCLVIAQPLNARVLCRTEDSFPLWFLRTLFCDAAPAS